MAHELIGAAVTDRQSARLKKRFLESFRVTGNISESCKAAGIGSRHTIYAWQEHDAEFLLAFHEAELQATESLETEARRRASAGVEEPVYQGGVQVGTVTKYSDTLLIFLLKARAPEKYREVIKTQGTLSGPSGGPVQVSQAPTQDLMSVVIAAAEQAAMAALYGTAAGGTEDDRTGTI